MSLKSLIQVIIILIIMIILGGVYYNYFANNSKISLKNNEKNIQTEIDTDKTKIKIIPEEADKKSEINVDEKSKNEEIKEAKSENVNVKKKIKKDKPEINNLVKDIEYLTTDKNGNKYKILATSGRTNSENKNILDLDDVRGVITSDKRSAVYIVSDFAEYNSSNLNSNFYQNVVVNFEDKEITCDYFDVNMKTNIAKAYNNVVVTEPGSIMKADKIILNIETNVIDINPKNNENEVTITID